MFGVIFFVDQPGPVLPLHLCNVDKLLDQNGLRCELVMFWFLQEMQLVLLKYREDLITAKVAEEHSSEVLKSEIMFLRTHLVGEQQERNNLEESLTQEISQLQNQIGNIMISHSSFPLNCSFNRHS